MASNTVATAYVQVVPSAEGIKGSLTKLMGGEANDSGSKLGGLLGSSLVGTLKKVIVAAGIGKMIKASFTEGANIEQSFGGLETIYGDAAEAAKNYAREASKAGISSNSFAEQAVSFGASLKAAYGGDMTKAIDAANTAIMDMADNSAKMGTDIASIQNAYQGFAKQNYTMLDNLKLGYGGTKSEMERLLVDAEKLSGVKYDINNLGDVYDAIHVIQQDLGLTGVAADEAAHTFSGSFAAMKASAANLLGFMSSGEGDVKQAMTQLVTSATDFLIGNAVPMAGRFIMAIPPALIAGVEAAVPQIMEVGQSILEGVSQGVSEDSLAMFDASVEAIAQFLDGVLQNLPSLMESGAQMLGSLLMGIINNFPRILQSALNLISVFMGTILQNLPKILQTGIQLIGQLIVGIIQFIPRIPGYVMQIINAIRNAFGKYNWDTIGQNIINGVVKGITSSVGKIVTAAKNAAKSAFDAAKDFLGIQSPSRLFRKEVGMRIAEGMALGIEDGESKVTNAIDALSASSVSSFDANYSVNSNNNNESAVLDILTKWLPQLANQQIVLDSGTLVGQTARQMDMALGRLSSAGLRGAY